MISTQWLVQGRANDLNKEFRQAKSQGKIIVSPHWLYAVSRQLSALSGGGWGSFWLVVFISSVSIFFFFSFFLCFLFLLLFCLFLGFLLALPPPLSLFQFSSSFTSDHYSWQGVKNKQVLCFHLLLLLDVTHTAEWALTLSLPQPVKFLAGKCINMPENNIRSGPITNPLSVLCVLVKIISNAKNKQGFQILHFHGSFSSDMAMKGLKNKQENSYLPMSSSFCSGNN